MDAPQAPEHFSIAPTRVIIGGEVRSLGPGAVQPYVPPAPAATPMRVVVDGDVIEARPPPAQAEDPRIETLLDEAEYADAYLSMSRSYHTPYEYEVAQREVKKFVANQQKRKETGRLFLEPWEYQPLRRPPWLKDEDEARRSP